VETIEADAIADIEIVASFETEKLDVRVRGSQVFVPVAAADGVTTYDIDEIDDSRLDMLIEDVNDTEEESVFAMDTSAEFDKTEENVEDACAVWLNVSTVEDDNEDIDEEDEDASGEKLDDKEFDAVIDGRLETAAEGETSLEDVAVINEDVDWLGKVEEDIDDTADALIVKLVDIVSDEDVDTLAVSDDSALLDCDGKAEEVINADTLGDDDNEATLVDDSVDIALTVSKEDKVAVASAVWVDVDIADDDNDGNGDDDNEESGEELVDNENNEEIEASLELEDEGEASLDEDAVDNVVYDWLGDADDDIDEIADALIVKLVDIVSEEDDVAIGDSDKSELLDSVGREDELEE
jgi:hypothetical protein